MKTGDWITVKEALKAYDMDYDRLKYLVRKGELEDNGKTYKEKRIKYIAGKTFDYDNAREPKQKDKTSSNSINGKVSTAEKLKQVKLKLELMKLPEIKEAIRKEYDDELHAELYDKLNTHFKPLLESLKLTPEQIDILNEGWKKVCPVE